MDNPSTPNVEAGEQAPQIQTSSSHHGASSPTSRSQSTSANDSNNPTATTTSTTSPIIAVTGGQPDPGSDMITTSTEIPSPPAVTKLLTVPSSGLGGQGVAPTLVAQTDGDSLFQTGPQARGSSSSLSEAGSSSSSSQEDDDGTVMEYVVVFRNEEDDVSTAGWGARAMAAITKNESYVTRSLAKAEERRVGRAELVAGLRHARLAISRVKSQNGKRFLVKIGASWARLEEEAENMRMKLPLKTGAYEAFTRFQKNAFELSPDTQHYFSSAQRLILLRRIITNPQSIGGAGFDPAKATQSGIISQFFPLHRRDLRDKLEEEWLPKRSILQVIFSTPRPPLDSIRNYFGEETAFYFAFLAFYTRWLVAPSLIGLALFLYQLSTLSLDLGDDFSVDFNSDTVFSPFFALGVSIWAELFLEYWKRESARLSHRWGILNKARAIEVPRAEYHGDIRISPITGKEEVWEPTHKRYLRYLITIPANTIPAALLVAAMVVLFSIDPASVDPSAATGDESDLFTTYAPRALVYGIFIPVFNFVYDYIAVRTNDYENYRWPLEYDNVLRFKIYTFQFLNSYFSLFWIAYANLALQGPPAVKTMERLAIQLASFLIAGQALGQVREVGLPTLWRKMQLYWAKRQLNSIKANASRATLETLPHIPSDLNGKPATPTAGAAGKPPVHPPAAPPETPAAAAADQATPRSEAVPVVATKVWRESNLREYSTLEDFVEISVQFGYIALWAVAFPLAPLVSYINNVYELRTDAYKILHNCQRTPPHIANSIGSWMQVFRALAWLSTINSLGIIGYGSTHLSSLTGDSYAFKLLLLLAVEHMIFMTKATLNVAIPDFPADVDLAVKREAYNLEQYQNKLLSLKVRAEHGQADSPSGTPRHRPSSAAGTGLRRRRGWSRRRKRTASGSDTDDGHHSSLDGRSLAVMGGIQSALANSRHAKSTSPEPRARSRHRSRSVSPHSSRALRAPSPAPGGLTTVVELEEVSPDVVNHLAENPVPEYLVPRPDLQSRSSSSSSSSSDDDDDDDGPPAAVVGTSSETGAPVIVASEELPPEMHVKAPRKRDLSDDGWGKDRPEEMDPVELLKQVKDAAKDSGKPISRPGQAMIQTTAKNIAKMVDPRNLAKLGKGKERREEDAKKGGDAKREGDAKKEEDEEDERGEGENKKE